MRYRGFNVCTRSLREIWSLHIVIGRWSLFIGVGEVRVAKRGDGLEELGNE